MNRFSDERRASVPLAEEQSPFVYPPKLRIAWQRRSLVLLGVVIGLVCGGLYYAKATPSYLSTAQIVVTKTQPEVLASSGGNAERMAMNEDYLSWHLGLIRSELNIKRAIKRPEVSGLKSLAGLADPTQTIIKSLKVERDKDAGGNYNNILNLSLVSRDPNDSAVILRAIIDSYKDFLNDKYKSGNTDTLNLITQARDVLEQNLSKKEAAYKEFRLHSPLVQLKTKEGNNLYQDRLSNIENRRADLLVRQAELEGAIAAIEQALKSGVKGASLQAVLQSTASDKVDQPENAKDKDDDRLYPLLLEAQTLTQRYGPDHPRVRELQRRIAFARQYAVEKEATPVTPIDGAKVRQLVQSRLQSMRSRLEELKLAQTSLDRLFQEAQKESRSLVDYEVREDAFRRDIARAQQLYDGIIRQLNEVDVTKKLGHYDALTIAEPAAGRKVSPRIQVILPISLLLGLLTGFGLALLAYTSDKSFHDPDELGHALNAPVLAHVPFFSASANAGNNNGQAGHKKGRVDAPLWSLYRPRSVEAEVFRGVRTAMYFKAQEKGHKILQITSASQGDGKTTLAANLAVAIAQSGKRVLLVDCDFRKPRVHKVFNLHPQMGVASVIDGAAELSEVVLPSGISGLDCLPCGPIPPNPAELLSAPRFQELLQVLREQYDYVLIDTPPLLAVTDPCVVASRVDGVMLVVRVVKNGRPDAIRARELLDSFGAELLGVVVNGAGARSGYSYKYYQYKDKYTYGYYKYHTEDGETENGAVAHTNGTPVAPVHVVEATSGDGAVDATSRQE